MVFKPILTKREVKRVVSEFKRSLKIAGLKAIRLILFGSYALGKPHPWSDIDICVLSPQFGKMDFDETVRLSKIAKGINYLIEALPMNPKDFELALHPLAEEIKKVGKEM